MSPDIMLKIKMRDLKNASKDVLYYYENKQWALLERSVKHWVLTSNSIKQNLDENEMTLPAFKKLLSEKKMKDTYANVSPKKRGDIFEEVQNIEVTEKMASGGRAGYAEGIGPLEDLQKWWKEQAWNNEG